MQRWSKRGSFMGSKSAPFFPTFMGSSVHGHRTWGVAFQSATWRGSSAVEIWTWRNLMRSCRSSGRTRRCEAAALPLQKGWCVWSQDIFKPVKHHSILLWMNMLICTWLYMVHSWKKTPYLVGNGQLSTGWSAFPHLLAPGIPRTAVSFRSFWAFDVQILETPWDTHVSWCDPWILLAKSRASQRRLGWFRTMGWFSKSANNPNAGNHMMILHDFAIFCQPKTSWVPS